MTNKGSLAHLSESQIDELIKRYYDWESVPKLLKEYQIDSSPSYLYTLFPPIIYNDKQCPHCEINMEGKRRSRNQSGPFIYCPECDHHEGDCHCSGCARLELFRNECKKTLIRERYDFKNYEPVSEQSLSLRDKILLGSFLRNGLDENYFFINPLEKQKGIFAPTFGYEVEILRSLISKQIIAPHPCSSSDAFKEGTEFPNIYYIDKVHYQVNIETDNLKELFDRLMNPTQAVLQDSSIEDLYQIWEEIALHECIEYLSFKLSKVKFPFTPGEKTITVFKDLLATFSVSQIYMIIHRCVANATSYYLEKKISKQQAANSVIGNCQRYGENALANNWRINGFRRDFDCPQSTLSHFYFSRVMMIGDLGFEKSPKSFLTECERMNNR